MNISRKSILSSFLGISLFFPKSGLLASDGITSLSAKSPEKTKCHFDQWKKTGTFKKTHENCVPAKSQRTVTINKYGWLQVERSGLSLMLSKLEWNGFEARSKFINPDILEALGIYGCNAIYCRPVSIPGGEALWISFLREASSRDPILDELYSREEEFA